MKKFIFIGLVAAALLGLTACGSEAGTAQVQPEQTTQAVETEENMSREDPTLREQTEYISAVPEGYFAPPTTPGKWWRSPMTAGQNPLAMQPSLLQNCPDIKARLAPWQYPGKCTGDLARSRSKHGYRI